MDADTIRELETIAENAWPAAEVRVVDGWRLRHTQSISRRVDSVSANTCDETMDLETRLDAVEAFYAERNAPARFHLTPLSAPESLVDVLDDRGYTPFAETTVQTVAVEIALQNLRPSSEFSIELTPNVTPDWLAIYGESGGWDDDVVALRRGILDRSRPQQIYALLRTDGEPCAVGRGVIEEGWLGIFCMGTLAECRGRGAGTAVLRALIAEGQGKGIRRVYLQVMPDNTPAIGLYRRAGFTTQYEYYYREKPCG